MTPYIISNEKNSINPFYTKRYVLNTKKYVTVWDAGFGIWDLGIWI